ncbi:MAG: peroxiredoxin [Bryobacterales bacterium]|nr:peroxiredoxin [Bryobacterales bacterium]
MEPAYADGVSAPAATGRPNPRAVSQIVNREDVAIPNPLGASAFVWQWGQFLDHDLDLTGSAQEAFHIPAPMGDPMFDPLRTGRMRIDFFRSIFQMSAGVRQQVNLITSCIDASNVYGSDLERARMLRTTDSSGKLATSRGGLLPFNEHGMPNDGGPSADLFLAGDQRANEQIGLTAMHTLFVREHNRLAGLLHVSNPRMSRDRIYEWARALVAAEMQAITYREFLPLLLGPDALPPYQGYRQTMDPSISNVFSTAAFRVGHTMLNAQLLRLQADGASVPEGPLPLAESFFRPDLIQAPGALEALLRGLAGQRARAVDPYVTDAVRNFLFGQPGAGGFDLAALNIQRGRDHGLPDYNTVRSHMGLARKTSFATISSDPEIQRRLEEAYGSVDVIDPWVGGLAEDRLEGRMVGELVYSVLRKQFLHLRDGDPYWYQRTLEPSVAAYVESLTLSRIIQLNTEIGDELPADVFHAPADAPY